MGETVNSTSADVPVNLQPAASENGEATGASANTTGAENKDQKTNNGDRVYTSAEWDSRQSSWDKNYQKVTQENSDLKSKLAKYEGGSGNASSEAKAPEKPENTAEFKANESIRIAKAGEYIKKYSLPPESLNDLSTAKTPLEMENKALHLRLESQGDSKVPAQKIDGGSPGGAGVNFDEMTPDQQWRHVIRNSTK